ncbi:MAG: DMT family transporter [Cypionkella sp.]|uniref:DMT family transporter n=1 Tax=Cypionkella sp. TaxID=2811411 RepID=UPI002ABA4C2B|nr:DMT family transporter [Cypionkella sp.]MDZ4312508.1 DMT family transporter [Cypionkella sp.]MDZ4395483.1 DMT family transporter [Cypionkella sp.]
MASDNLRGILFMVVSMALFGLEDMFLKWAAASLPVGEIVFVSGVFGVPVFVFMAWRQGHKVFTKAGLHPWVLARGLGEMVGTFAYITALATVPLSTVSAVLQAMPLAVTMAAAVFMQEQVGWRRWSAIAVGFAGVMLVIRPGLDGFRPEALWVLITVAGLTLRDLAARKIPPECSTAQVSAWGLISVTLLGALMMLGSGEVVMPSPWEATTLLGALVFGTAGYWAIIGATRTGEVSVVAPFRYVRLVFAVLIGAFVFAEWPDVITLCGSGLIVASGLYSFARERARKRTLSLNAPFG